MYLQRCRIGVRIVARGPPHSQDDEAAILLGGGLVVLFSLRRWRNQQTRQIWDLVGYPIEPRSRAGANPVRRT